MSEIFTPDDESIDGSESGIVSEQVMILANSILAELQRVMDTYAVEAHDFTQLTGLITSALEELDFSLTEKSKASFQLEQMEIEMAQLLQRLNEERESRQATDERYISLEDSYGTERRKLLSQVQQVQNENKQLVSKLQTKADHVARLEEERDDINRRYQEHNAKHTEDIGRYLRKIEQLQATEDALRQRTTSVVQKRFRSSSTLSSSSQSKERSLSQKATDVSPLVTSPTEPPKLNDEECSSEKASEPAAPSSVTRGWKEEMMSPTTDLLGNGASTSLHNVIQDMETRRAQIDQEDEKLYAVEQEEIVDEKQNTASLSEELLLSNEPAPHVEQVKQLMSEAQLLETQRQKLTSKNSSLTVQIEELQSEVVKQKTEIQMKEANEQLLEHCIEHLKGEIRRYKEAEKKGSVGDADGSKKKGVLSYTKTELDSVLRQYHFYKEKCHDLQEELQRTRAAALASSQRHQSGIRKLLSRLFTKISGSSSPAPRRADRTLASPRADPSVHRRQKENLKLLSASMTTAPWTVIDTDSFVITNSWKVGHGGIIDPTAPALPMYHSSVPVPEAGVLLLSSVSVCCPCEPVSSVAELQTVPHRVFIWTATFNNDEASQIHVVDVTVPMQAKVTESFLVSDSKVPTMVFVPTIAARAHSGSSAGSETTESLRSNDSSRESYDSHEQGKRRLVKDANEYVAKTFYHSSIWVGTESGWIYIYSTISDPGRQLLVQDMDHPVQCIRFLFDSVFVGTSDGTLAMFKSCSTACCGWDLSNHKRLPLDSKSSLVLSVCMEAVDDQLWVGCSNMINIVDPVTFVVKTSFSVRNRLSSDVSGICCIGKVVCVSMHRSPQLFFLHAHGTQLLQEIDITGLCNLIDCEPAAPLHQPYVSCMLSVNQQIWIGTASGVVMILHLKNAKLNHYDLHTGTNHGHNELGDRHNRTTDQQSVKGAPFTAICSYEDAQMSCFGHLNGVRCLLAVTAEDILKCTMRDITGSFESDDAKQFSWMFSGGYGFVDLQLKDTDERNKRRRLSGVPSTPTLRPVTGKLAHNQRGYCPDSRYDSQQFLFWKL
ncbi:uncharacterized protein LOC134190483 isoform X2 [Corticium candelabrum]|uniref:uncharacterized protein LOC134190483 isoform X2 n=1 Tax=Corticium candelabrum TaxID=121492 RepID=UPI002E256106|nr:uncharacterized protein LOC134190483 isoform X2 [Corticium candelabrum]